ncbi:MAG: circadian clock KaiB family protein [bacterium]
MDKYVFRLYVFDHTTRSKRAIENMHRICEDELKGNYELTIIDLLEHPEATAEEKIVATPTLIKKLPSPAERIIGDLSNREQVLKRLDINQWE